jgi:glycosyltransferase involved in cell wall biosynthesis
MHIWQLVDSSSIGGIERHIELLADALIEKGYSCEVVLLERHGNSPWLQQLDAGHIPYRHLKGSIRGLAAALRDQRPAVIHTHGYKAGILGRLAARWCGVPVISTWHAGERGPGKLQVYQAIDAWTGCLAFERISVAQTIADRLPWPSHVIANFVRVPESDAMAAGSRIAFLGRLSHEKGPDLFCEIAQRVAVGTWDVYGDGPLRGELEERYSEHVNFHGLVTDLGEAWRTISLTVISSRAEGLPLVALESLAHGIPVIAARVGALDQVIIPGETGFLFDAGDTAMAAKYVEQWLALDSEKKAAMAAACRNKIRAGYSAASRLPAILDIYHAAGLTGRSTMARVQSSDGTPRAAISREI